MVTKTRPQISMDDKIVENPELEQLLEDRQKLKQSVADYRKVDKDAKEAPKLIDPEYPAFITPLISPPGKKPAQNQKTGRAPTTTAKEARTETVEQTKKSGKELTPPAPSSAGRRGPGFRREEEENQKYGGSVRGGAGRGASPPHLVHELQERAALQHPS